MGAFFYALVFNFATFFSHAFLGDEASGINIVDWIGASVAVEIDGSP